MTTTPANTHPELLSKPALLERYREAAKAARLWHGMYQLGEYNRLSEAAPNRDRTPEDVMDEAHLVYVAIGPDPDATQHAADLLNALNAGPDPKDNA